jgi:23S rRNA pseudouridine1911/1915/1917 synthase
MGSLDVLYEDNHLLVVNKPAGLPTQGAAAGEDSLVVRAKEYLKRKYDKPGNVYVGVVSRLDALVTGVVVLARTSKAAARLSEQFREAEVAKTYWAVVEGIPKASDATLVDWLAKDERQRKMVVVDSPADSASQGQEARLRFRQIAALPGRCPLLEVNLDTGRKHQIRVQLAHYGCPIVGDAKYGALRPFPEGIALHARRLVVIHPTLQTRLEFIAPLPESWRSLQLNEEKAVKLESNSPR